MALKMQRAVLELNGTCYNVDKLVPLSWCPLKGERGYIACDQQGVIEVVLPQFWTMQRHGNWSRALRYHSGYVEPGDGVVVRAGSYGILLPPDASAEDVASAEIHNEKVRRLVYPNESTPDWPQIDIVM
jgi:hypothetical protein